MFDLDRLEQFTTDALAAFARAHAGELFYAFAIDAQLLCLAELSDFEAGLAHVRGKGREPTAQEFEDLRNNTGDWRYQGFAEMNAAVGFDTEAYAQHYRSDAASQRTSAYAQAMDTLLQRLTARRAFDALQRTPDFVATRVEHGD